MKAVSGTIPFNFKGISTISAWCSSGVKENSGVSIVVLSLVGVKQIRQASKKLRLCVPSSITGSSYSIVNTQ